MKRTVNFPITARVIVINADQHEHIRDIAAMACLEIEQRVNTVGDIRIHVTLVEEDIPHEVEELTRKLTITTPYEGQIHIKRETRESSATYKLICPSCDFGEELYLNDDDLNAVTSYSKVTCQICGSEFACKGR